MDYIFRLNQSKFFVHVDNYFENLAFIYLLCYQLLINNVFEIQVQFQNLKNK